MARKPRDHEAELKTWLDDEYPTLAWYRELIFHPKREWRFDIGCVDIMCALEIDGMVWQGEGGRHQRGKGYEGDCVKIAEAMIMGWHVLRVTPRMLTKGTAHDLIRRFIDTKI